MVTATLARPSPRITVNQGGAVNPCCACAFSKACAAEGMDHAALMDLQLLMQQVGPVSAGEHLFRDGDPFDTIAAVRSGTVKTYVTDRDGREHVLGFHLPGEVIGLIGIDGDHYPCNAVALDTVMLCRFSFPKISVLAARLPGLQKHLFRLMSRDIGSATMLAGDCTAEQRMAAFLVGMSRRHAARGLSPDRFQLAMTRTDIANYLRLAPETVSRVLKRMQDDRVLRVDRRDVQLLDCSRLETLGESMLRH